MGDAGDIVEMLRLRGLTLSCAESCTGGLLADAFVSVSGASSVFLGGVVAYDGRIKRSVLGVSAAELADGAVSASCASAMAARARALFGSDIALSTTGYAEKSDRPDVADGVIFVGFSSGAGAFAEMFAMGGGRNENRAAAVSAALGILRRALERGNI